MSQKGTIELGNNDMKELRVMKEMKKGYQYVSFHINSVGSMDILVQDNSTEKFRAASILINKQMVNKLKKFLSISRW